ncbi:MAG TPA: transketolase [Candidatus Coprenecus stercoripullorum]|nr:transketolase [Candidatus Coprenecus stercoripullorum]
MSNEEKLTRIASQVRRDIIRMVTGAASGHPGGSLSSADFVTALFFEVMEHSPEHWDRSGKGNDMFFLSAGHLSPLFYSVLARSGYFPVDELSTFRRFGSRLQGHPSVAKGLPGVYEPSGSLGQGLSVACGAALGKRLSGDNHKVYVLCGDGESQEGQIWEAALFGAMHGIDNLIAMTDWNGQQIDGPVESVMSLGNLRAKWEAFGWRVLEADGHDMRAILDVFAEAGHCSGEKRPVMILFKTEMGHGVDFMAGTHKWHGKAPSAEQCERALSELEETLGDYKSIQ